MNTHLPTELYLLDDPGSANAVEHLCSVATGRSPFEVVAIAVSPPHVERASTLLLGTGIAVISALNQAGDFVSQARLSVARGATEIALPRLVLDLASTLKHLKGFLGSATPTTVNITSDDGDVSLDLSEYALALGADYVTYAPTTTSKNAAAQATSLVALAGALELGGVKLESTSLHHLVALHENEWARSPGNARVRVPVAAT